MHSGEIKRSKCKGASFIGLSLKLKLKLAGIILAGTGLAGDKKSSAVLCFNLLTGALLTVD